MRSVALIPLMTGNKIRAYATEAEAALGTVRSALRVYYAEHDKDYPTLAAGAVADRVSGIETDDLLGTFFSDANYTITSSTTAYSITCTFDNPACAACTAPQCDKVCGLAHSVSLNQDGDWTRSY